MKYYIVALDFTDRFFHRTYLEGDILNEFEVKQKYNFCEDDINNYFIPIKTSQRNIYRSFGKRKIKDWKQVKVLHKYESEDI